MLLLSSGLFEALPARQRFNELSVRRPKNGSTIRNGMLDSEIYGYWFECAGALRCEPASPEKDPGVFIFWRNRASLVFCRSRSEGTVIGNGSPIEWSWLDTTFRSSLRIRSFRFPFFVSYAIDFQAQELKTTSMQRSAAEGAKIAAA